MVILLVWTMILVNILRWPVVQASMRVIRHIPTRTSQKNGLKEINKPIDAQALKSLDHLFV